MAYFDILCNLIVFIMYLIFLYTFLLPILNVIVQLLYKWQNKLVLYPFDPVRDLLLKSIPCGTVILGLFVLQEQTEFDWILKLSAPVFIIFHHFISRPDKKELFENNALNIGYGAALWYYKNFLAEIQLHSKFIERIKKFESQNGVEVLHKLFLLVPDSCMVPESVEFEDEKDCIERCQELEPFQKTNAGIKGRVYNNTVYLLQTREGNKRMVIEYVQPCKGLYIFKTKNIITEDEMIRQREILVSSLRKFLDENEGYKYCEIVQFNDKKQKVSNALNQHCSIFSDIF